ncbi:MAG: serine/threonine-protein kinase [Deltaproteobacteria bacterium]|nr:serine/threonine-protein kinase [Deltaproteobacteria bacterium]
MGELDEKQQALWQRADEVFDALLDVEQEARHTALEAMALEDTLRRRVEMLLAANEESAAVLDAGPKTLFEAIEDDVVGLAKGTVVGGWTVGELLGRGGMGLVYQATRQGVDFHQQAALKLLRVAMRDREGLSRFRREQQILAKLEHPSIARLIDGGVTSDGSPYLVIEEVTGAPIDSYCRDHDLEARGVVELFLEVADGIAFAHRNLIVHRDLKPANIMVDGGGRVRLLDFGIAKLLGDEAIDPGTRVLTPGFGAPEQMTGAPVSTATDVFAMGVVLYDLLAHTRPFDSADPAAAHRPEAPSSSAKCVSGINSDLDNVVMMALRPEPERRYPSAEAMADDLRKWLGGHPLRATPDSFGYRLGKSVARHRIAALFSTIAALGLVIGASVATWQARVARQESTEAKRQLARAEAVTEFIVDTFKAADPNASGGNEVTAREILDQGITRIDRELDDAPDVRRRLRSVLGEISYYLGDLERAESLLSSNLHGVDESLAARIRNLRFAARTASKAGNFEIADQRYEEAERLARNADATTRADVELFYAAYAVERRRYAEVAERLESAVDSGWLEGASPKTRAAILGTLASALNSLGRFAEAKEHSQVGLALFEEMGGSATVEYAGGLGIQANIEANLGNIEGAEALKRRSLEIQLERLGPRHPDSLTTRNDLATLLKNLGRFSDSAVLLEALLVEQLEVLGDHHPNVAITYFNLAEARFRAGELEAALEDYRETLRRVDAAPTNFGATGGIFRAIYGRALARSGEFENGEAELRRGLEVLTSGEAEYPLAARVRVELAAMLNERGRFPEALEELERSVETLESTYGSDSRELALAHIERGRALQQARPERAIEDLHHGLQVLEASPFRAQYRHEIASATALVGRLTNAQRF